MISFVFWKFPISVAMRSSLLNDVFWNRKKVQCIFNGTTIGHCFFLRDAHMYNRQCLHFSMISMLCTAFWCPSRAIQTVLCCPRPESSALTSHWTGCRLCFVVDRVEEHVDLGGSRVSKSILERLCSVHASQQNVVTLEFGSPCSPRSALYALDLNRRGLQQVARFDHVPFQRWDSCCHQMNVFGVFSFQQRLAPIYPKKQLLREKNFHRSPGNGMFFLPSCTVLVSVPTTGGPDLSVLTTGLPVRSRLGFGIGWFDWKLLDGCTTCPSEYNKLDGFHEKW